MYTRTFLRIELRIYIAFKKGEKRGLISVLRMRTHTNHSQLVD
jgi:hypothetical protein